MKLLNKNTALIVVDFQKGFDNVEYWGNRNNLMAEANGKIILDIFRKLQLPVFIIQHCSQNPESIFHESNDGNALKDDFIPLKNEYLIKKNVNSSFIGTDLKEYLDKLAINNTVIVGLTTIHCVSTTARMSGNYGFDTYVVEDACAAFDRIGINGEKYSAQDIHNMELSCLNDEFANVISTNEIIQMLTK